MVFDFIFYCVTMNTRYRNIGFKAIFSEATHVQQFTIFTYIRGVNKPLRFVQRVAMNMKTFLKKMQIDVERNVAFRWSASVSHQEFSRKLFMALFQIDSYNKSRNKLWVFLYQDLFLSTTLNTSRRGGKVRSRHAFRQQRT